MDTSTKPNLIKYLPLAGVAAAVILALVVWFSVNNSVTNTGNKKQNGLNAQYNDNINYLSDCIVRVTGTANIAAAQTERVGQVLIEVVKGRYDNQLAAATPGNSPALISSIIEDYPDMRPFTEVFSSSINVLNGCRTDYRDKQTDMQDKIRDFDDWRTGSWTTRTFGGEYPTNGLLAKKGSEILKGEAALTQMRTVVVVSDANKAYETGELESPDPFGVNRPKG